jgi:predicted P-loop ATPase
MTQKLLILDDEFSGKSKQDAKKMKRLLSASHFDLRPPYGAENVQLKRIAVLAGTCNETEVLNDPTGNRRFIVFDVQERMDWGLFNSIDKEQLFAQLKKFWDNGITGNLAIDEIEEMELLTNSKHSEVSIEEELILKYYHLPSTGGGFESYTNTEIKVYLEQSTNQKISSRKLGLELKKLGYEQKSIRNQNTILRKFLIAKNLMHDKGV